MIARVANRQGGVISRQQLIARGLDRAGIDNRVKVGFLRVVHRGVYAVGHDAVPVRGRLCAALLVAGPGSALSHRTAAHVLGLLPSMPPFVETTTTRHRRADRRRGLDGDAATFWPIAGTATGAIAVAAPQRAGCRLDRQVSTCLCSSCGG